MITFRFIYVSHSVPKKIEIRKYLNMFISVIVLLCSIFILLTGEH